MTDVKIELLQPPPMLTIKPTSPSSSISSPTPMKIATSTTLMDDTKPPPNGTLRAPKCTRCRNHGVVSDLRGHKHKCFWRDCTCTKCLISSDRQRATADRIALFRQQVRQLTVNDRRQRNDKRQHPEEDTPKYLQSPPPISATSPRKLPPPLPKMSSKPPPYVRTHSRLPSPIYWNDSKVRLDKNMEILRQVFPFYDPGSLNVISRENKNDLLQTVLSISACLLENRHSKSDAYYSIPPSFAHHHPPISKMMSTGKCCSSPYCPINSYLNLRQKSPEIMQHLPTPPLTATSPYTRDATSNITFTVGPKLQPSAKKFRFSIDEYELPYCESCKKYGIKGDTFCPLCGILFPR